MKSGMHDGTRLPDTRWANSLSRRSFYVQVDFSEHGEETCANAEQI